MPCVNKYLQDYLGDCCKNKAIQLKSYKKVRSSLTNAGTEEKIIEDFEQSFYNHLVLILEAYFIHRSRTPELKDGNAANEVRMLSGSNMYNGNSNLWLWTGQSSTQTKQPTNQVKSKTILVGEGCDGCEIIYDGRSSVINSK